MIKRSSTDGIIMGTILSWEKFIFSILRRLGQFLGSSSSRLGFYEIIRARSLVVSDLHSETKGCRFESGCQLCAEVNSLQ